MKKILIVEDESHIADGLKYNLEAEGFSVSHVLDGESALEELQGGGNGFDVVVLDVMLPGISGFDVARRMREAADFTPILMLTARGRPEDVMEGFDAGTDDYLSKPFELGVFLARLNGLLRRSEWAGHASADEEPRVEVRIEGLAIDFDKLEIRSGGETIHLTLMEAKLLEYLIENTDKAVSRKEILENVWDLHEDTDTRAIDNFVVRLRKYIEPDPSGPKYLKTVRGVGYRFVFPD